MIPEPAAAALAVGLVAAFLVGFSKTALPGAALVATPLIATVVSGRALPGTVLPILIAADVFAVAWYRQHARWDLLRGLAAWVSVGFVIGGAFFVAVGSASRPIDVVIGVIVLTMVVLQAVRTVRGAPPGDATRRGAALYGTTGGFTTFVANTAGPVMNSYMVGLGLDKHQMIGTSAWFYFVVNVAKIPLYVALGELSDGGRFFTTEQIGYTVVLLPAVVAGVYAGRWLFPRIDQRVFLGAVLALAGAGAVRLLLP